METVKATLWIYRIAVRRTSELLVGNWGIVFAPLAYSVILSIATALRAPLGFIGGIVFTAVSAACASSGLHLIENVVRGSKVGLNDFVRGFAVYLWEILGIAFILWIPMMLLSQVAYSTPQGPLVILLVRILLYIVLNPVPELIYQTPASGVGLLSASYEFIVENWIEWFAPNVLIAVAAYWLIGWVDLPAEYVPSFVRFFFIFAVFGVLLTFLMIFRGLLFSELNGTTRRSRAYRYRARASG
jgi:hypothetical protein